METHMKFAGEQKTLRGIIKMIKGMQAFPYEGRLTSYGAGLYALFVQHSLQCNRNDNNNELQEEEISTALIKEYTS